MNATGPPPHDPDPLGAALGSRLRQLRRAQGLTQADLSGRTGISVGVLSRLESGERTPTLRHLLSLARAHRIGLDDLVGAGDGTPTVRMPVMTRRGMDVVRLTDRPGGLQAYRLRVPVVEPGDEPGTAAETPRLHVHKGRNWLCVLSGRLRLVLEEHDIVLTAGEVAEYDASARHWYGATGPGDAEVIAIFGVQGEGLRLRVSALSSRLT